MALFKYSVGDYVYVKSQKRQGKIVKPGSPINGMPFYSVDLGSSTPTLVGERDLELAESPLIKLANHDYGESDDFDLLTHAMTLYFAYRYEGWSCLSNARLDPKPYQVFVAHRTLQDLYPRYILADEVGLGKTIEAGLILKELKARGLANRVLIITPASLREQWQGELKAKFNETFQIYDSTTIKENQRRYARRNPWEIDDYIITSLHFARRQSVDENQASEDTGVWLDEVDWDLVIIDEAHHLRRKLNGRKVEYTKAYRLGQTLAEKTNALLLLTATPMQLSTYEAYSLIELVDSSLFTSYSDFQNHLSLRENKDWQTVMSFSLTLTRRETYAIEQAYVIVPLCFTLMVEKIYALGLETLFWNSFMDTWSKLTSAYHLSTIKEDLAELKYLMDTASQENNGFLGFAERLRYEIDPLGIRSKVFTTVSNYREVFDTLPQTMHRLSQVMIRNRKREVLKGEVVDRKAYKVEVRPTSVEKLFYQHVSTYIRQSYARASSQNNSAVGFVLTIFRKLLVSSPIALAVSLEKRAARIEDALKDNTSPSKKISSDELAELDETIESVDDLDELLNLIGSASLEDARIEIDQLRDLAAQARNLPTDSKADKLLAEVGTLLQDNPAEKILVFTQFRETQNYLKSLFEAQGFQVALFHSEQGSSGYSKRSEFDRFKKDPEVQVMVSTEVGGEGLNLQFCHILFNYDLPWNPMRIEQRIGRLDRIGQQLNVHVYNFFLADTIDGRILDVLQNRIHLFEETIGNLDPILGDDIESSIRDMLLSSEVEAEQKLADLEELAIKRLKEAHEAEAKMADFVMDRESFRQDTLDKLLGRIPPVSNQEIELLARNFLTRYPHEDLFKSEEDKVYTIAVPDRFRQESNNLYGLILHETYKGTFDPAVAIQEDTIDFFAFGHPLIDAIIRYCIEHEKHGHFRSQTALRVIHHADHVGYEGIQFNYVVVFRGVQPHKRLIPLVFDQNGNHDEDFSQIVFDLDIVRSIETMMSPIWTLPLLENLYEKSQKLIAKITERDMHQFQERNTRNFTDLEAKTMRLFDYRMRNQRVELERRKDRLEDARQRKQTRIIPALEGQVKATIERIRNSEEEREIKLAELQNQKEAVLESIELLNVASIRIV